MAVQRAAFEQPLPDLRWFHGIPGKHGLAVPRHGTLDVETRHLIPAL